jgi:hypothetical protein
LAIGCYILAWYASSFLEMSFPFVMLSPRHTFLPSLCPIPSLSYVLRAWPCFHTTHRPGPSIYSSLLSCSNLPFFPSHVTLSSSPGPSPCCFCRSRIQFVRTMLTRIIRIQCVLTALLYPYTVAAEISRPSLSVEIFRYLFLSYLIVILSVID